MGTRRMVVALSVLVTLAAAGLTVQAQRGQQPGGQPPMGRQAPGQPQTDRPMDPQQIMMRCPMMQGMGQPHRPMPPDRYAGSTFKAVSSSSISHSASTSPTAA